MENKKSAWPYIKGYKFNILLLKTFVVVFILVTVPLLLVLSLNYNKFTDVVNNRVMDMNESILEKNAVVTDNLIAGLLDNANQISQLDSVMEIASIKEVDQHYYTKAEAAIKEIKTYTATNNMVVSVSIYSNVNGMLADYIGVRQAQQMWSHDKWYYLHQKSPMVTSYVLVDEENSVFVCQPIWSFTGKRVGLAVLKADLEKSRELLENKDTAQKGVFLVLDATGQIIYSNDRTFLKKDKAIIEEYLSDIKSVKVGESKVIPGQEKRVISVLDSDHKSWHYAFVSEMPDYREEVSMVRVFLISSIVVGFLSSLIVAYLITYITYRPIRKILNVIQNPKLHWNEKEASKQSNELLFITSHIMAESDPEEDISEVLDDRIRSLRQAQFRALQFQIDPHFLYNTLETIKWNAVAEMGIGNKTSKMLTKVARLYRVGLENDDVIVSLKEELDFLKLYIEIVRIRFGETIQFHWDIDETLYDCNVIKMCLQPIVENAIQHGLRPKNYMGSITVSAKYDAGCLHVSVEDDGQNISQTEMNKLNEKLKTGVGFEESKVGLRNVNERIKLIYGKKYGVRICNATSEEGPSGEETGVRVVLTFPCRNINRSEETK